MGARWVMAACVGLGSWLGLMAAQPRRARHRLVLRTVHGAVAAIGAAIFAGIWGTVVPAVRRVTLPIEQLPEAFDGVVVAQLSDFHLGMPFSIRSVRRAIAVVQAVRPHIIVLTGDFITHTHHLPLIRPMLSPLSAPLGVYAIFGNHDYLAGIEGVRAALEDANTTVLVNQHCRICKDGAVVVMAGLDDVWRGAPDLQATLAGVPEDAPVILLGHAPDSAEEAARRGVAVQLAGHTHGGHLRVPLLGSLVLPRHGILHDLGLARVGNMWLYVSAGLGGRPLRLGCRTEVTLHTLRRAA